jgi:cell pole-organizing protein PopZ
MAEDAPEQSMEDVLASIKRIISADVEAARRFPKPSAVASAEEEEDILELGEEPASAPDSGKGLVSGKAVKASKAALAALDTVKIDPNAAATTMDGLVREMLKPMLKEWLDANLPDLVERVVAREVARIIGR